MDIIPSSRRSSEGWAAARWGLRTIARVCALLECDDPKQAEFAAALEALEAWENDIESFEKCGE